MATITKQHHNVGPFESTGARDIEWRTFTGTANTSGLDLLTGAALADSHLEQLIIALAPFGTVTFIGTPTTLTVTVGFEGLGETDANIDTAITAANVGDDASATWVVATVVITGAGLA